MIYGRVIAKAGVLPTDPRAVQLFHNNAALLFMDFWQHKVEDERFKRLAKMLGVVWSRDDIEQAREQKERPTGKVPEEVFIPLALAIEPSLQEQVQKLFGRQLGITPPEWVKREDMVDTYQMPRDDFINFVDMFIRPKVVGKG